MTGRLPAGVRRGFRTAGSVVALVIATGTPAMLSAQVGEPVVHAVLFFSPACPHCHKVMTQDLPPLVERYGDRLVLVGVDVTSPLGGQLFDATADYFGIPESERGVPLLVVGSNVLVGSLEIPQRFPEIIETALAGAGLDWPEVPLVRTALAQQGLLDRTETPAPQPEAGTSPSAPESEPPVAATPVETAPESEPPGPASPVVDEPRPTERDAVVEPLGRSAPAALTMVERLRLDPAGNGTAVAVLLLLVLLVGMALRHALAPLPRFPAPRTRLIPLLCVLGMVVASYLAWVEITGVRAVCGPVGDCNTVQQSEFARLFGVVPVAVLGLVGYLAMVVTWDLGRRLRFAGRRVARWTLWGLTLVASVFSVYLTFLEPFVIGATCAWCVTSSLISGALLVLATAEVRTPSLPPDRPPPTVPSAA